jgi:sporulation protein YlmC with PRC-barrel domain
MKEALELCELFGNRMEIKFNPKKTQIMAIGGKKANETIKLCEAEIEWVDKMKYLGVWLNKKNNNKDHLNERRINTWRAYHSIKKEIGLEKKEMKPELKAFIWKSYIRPIAYYGLENVYPSKSDIKKVQTMEAKMIKRMLGLSTRTKNTHLLYALNIEPVEFKFNKLKINFFRRLLTNEYTHKIATSIRGIESKLNNEVVEITGKQIGEVRDEDLVIRVKEIVRMIQREKKNGIAQSIKTCLSHESERNTILLKLLIKAF